MGEPVEEIITGLCWWCDCPDELEGRCTVSGCYCCHDGCDFWTLSIAAMWHLMTVSVFAVLAAFRLMPSHWDVVS
jgi:hypothetical protein